MDFDFLSQTVLFQGVAPQEVAQTAQCLGAEERCYSKGVVIYRAGEPVEAMGLVLLGSVNIESDDLWGNKSILDNIGPGQVFAETYACIPGESMMVSVVAAEDTRLLFLNTARLLGTCPNGCEYHSQLIRNLLTVCARKNLSLSRRIFHTSSKSIRGRLLSYLSFQATQQGSRQFSIPFNRQQLADYLGVDRSALSGELSRMRQAGLITYQKNRFSLLDDFRQMDR